jgi:hypothetical protein
MNAHCERFNRTIREDCIDDHHNLLCLDDLTDFDHELLRCLALHNLGRPTSASPRPAARPRAGFPLYDSFIKTAPAI